MLKAELLEQDFEQKLDDSFDKRRSQIKTEPEVNELEPEVEIKQEKLTVVKRSEKRKKIEINSDSDEFPSIPDQEGSSEQLTISRTQPSRRTPELSQVRSELLMIRKASRITHLLAVSWADETKVVYFKCQLQKAHALLVSAKHLNPS